MLALPVMVAEEPPQTQTPRPLADPHWELIGWSRGWGSPRAIVGLTSESDAMVGVHFYRLVFRDRTSGRIRAGHQAHGLYQSAAARDLAAERHVREGFVDIAQELGPGATLQWVAP